MKLKTLLILILCNLIWSANPAMAKLILNDGASPMLTAWLRYSSALLAFVMISGGRSAFMRPKRGSDWLWVFVIGFMVFFFAPALQMTGLHASHATENALIVAMEPLITVFLAWLIVGEALSWVHLLAFAAALLGFSLLAGLNAMDFSLGGKEGAHLLGNLLMLGSLLGEACYSIAGRKLLLRYSPSGIFATALGIGVFFLTLTTIISGVRHGVGPVFAPLLSFGPKAWIGVLFVGPLGTALTYPYWMSALQEASIASVALTLFVQPVFGSVWGTLFLDERLSAAQWTGAAFILTAVVLSMVAPARLLNKK
ncbi:MAG: DMT family transporter [Oligoflexia bacterium]|nr:DMT family transporter [Oligoflexia bacterium]